MLHFDAYFPKNKLYFNEVLPLKKILVLFGGNSYEHYVSCKSAKSIVENMDKKLFCYELVGIDFDNKWYRFDDDLSYLENGKWKDTHVVPIDNIIEFIQKFDVVFPMIHGYSGEDGKLQGMLELFDIPFVGCHTLASALGMDKEMSKILFEHLGVPQVPYLILEEEKQKEIETRIGFPVIVKPANGGSSIGIVKADNKKQLKKAIKEVKQYDSKIIVEKFVKARELECAVLEKNNRIICSCLGEIKSANEIYDYNAKYVNEKSYTTIPDDLPDKIIKQIKEYAKQIFTRFHCNGYARIDFFYEEESNQIYINEINTIPGFTSISMYPKLMEHEEISYTDLLTILINSAMSK